LAFVCSYVFFLTLWLPFCGDPSVFVVRPCCWAPLFFPFFEVLNEDAFCRSLCRSLVFGPEFSRGRTVFFFLLPEALLVSPEFDSPSESS